MAEYGRVVLEGGKRRKRRKRAQTTPAVNIPAAPQSAPDVAKKTVPTAAPTVTSNVPVPPSENSPYRSRAVSYTHLDVYKRQDNAITSETSRKMARRNFVVTLSTMTPQNYEHITINTQP